MCWVGSFEVPSSASAGGVLAVQHIRPQLRNANAALRACEKRSKAGLGPLGLGIIEAGLCSAQDSIQFIIVYLSGSDSFKQGQRLMCKTLQLPAQFKLPAKMGLWDELLSQPQRRGSNGLDLTT